MCNGMCEIMCMCVCNVLLMCINIIINNSNSNNV